MPDLCKDPILIRDNDRTHGGGFLNRQIAFCFHQGGSIWRCFLKKVREKGKIFLFPPISCVTAIS